MRPLVIGGVAVLLASLAVARPVEAAPLKVGPGETYTTPCAAIAAAAPNDQIEVAPGTYTDSCAITVAGITVRGTGGQPKIDLSGTDHPAGYKGIYVVDADDVTIENLELTGAHISVANGENAAGIRIEAKGLTVRGCNIHDNQNGILGGTSGTITIEHTEFFDNGQGDGCNQGGCTHNVYIANIDTLYFRYNWSHRVATDTPDKGHLLKSRAKINYVLYNRLSGEDGFDSYEIDLPNGGLAVVVGNVIQKGKAAGNGTLLSWGEEGASNPDKRVFVVNNTFVNDLGSGRFVGASGATLSLNDNLFVGAGSVGNTGTLSGDNLNGVDPLFVDRAHDDYHLSAGSPAIGKGVDPGTADSFSLVADHEYVHPLGERARASAHDLGAFEFGTSTSPATDAGTPTAADGGSGKGSAGTGGRTAGAGGSAGAGTSGSHSATGSGGSQATASTAGAGGRAAIADGGASQGVHHAANGCGCSVLGSRTSSAVVVAAPGLLVAVCLRRTLSRRSRRRECKRCAR